MMPKRNKFSLSHYSIFSSDLGELVPCGAYEALPGDTIQQATSTLIRVSPMLAPVMHPVHVRIHHWFVPYRILWSEWEDFITGGPDGMDASEFPTIQLGSVAAGDLANYLGLPVTASPIEVSALPFRAYAHIWNEWYRDQDLQTELPVSDAGGVDTTTNQALQNCAWEKDYFTSARPFEQKGPDITIPLGDKAPVSGIGILQSANSNVSPRNVYEGVGGQATYERAASLAAAADAWQGRLGPDGYETNIYADLSQATGITVNQLRELLAFQRFQEARARYGSRYTEYLAYLGVRSSDARLQRPEYLGGGKQTLQFSEVLQTAEGSDPVGSLKGHGITAMRSNRWRRFFEEHGIVISLASVRPKTIYSNSVPRMWNRRIKEDFWQKELQHIGQQPVKAIEVYAGAANPDATFGYQDRYDEYRRAESRVAGEFATDELNFWHFARDFGQEPVLNGDFIKCVPAERPFAVPLNDVLWNQAYHSVQARRLVAATGSSFIF